MRVLPASHLKGKPRLPVQPKPREGTNLRALYDLFMGQRGLVIDLPISTMPQFGKPSSMGATLSQLRDFYGLDIRNLGYRRWILAGEWFGATYVDYVAERQAEANRKGNQP